MKTYVPSLVKGSTSHSSENHSKENCITQCKGFPAKTSYPVESLQLKEDRDGLPENLKSGIENLSGVSLDDVQVHYNSAKPALLNAHAYAQGTSIHLGPGQEKHLPHEAWHTVQQKQGRVRPGMQMKGEHPINADAALEREADSMGNKAIQTKSSANVAPVQLAKKKGKLASKADKDAREGAREARYAAKAEGGTTEFNNNEGRLPTAPRGQHYTETDVGKGRTNRGKRRVVSLVESTTGRVVKQYNTDDHYTTFS